MTLIDVLTAIVLILVSTFIIYLIVYLGKITRSIQTMQKDISDLSNRLEPLVASLTDLTEKFTDIGEIATRQLDVSKEIISSVKERVEKILQFEGKIRSGIEGPVMSVISQFKAISNGVSTFLSYLKK